MPFAAASGFRLLRNVPVPMRDGVCLATTVAIPEGDGAFPVILVRTAYNRVNVWGAALARRGIAFAAQDVRGRYGSDGEWRPFVNEAADGEDTLDWLAAQPWCNGRVGMYGNSYLASTSFYAALSGHPALVAANPRFMAGDCWKRGYYSDGALSLGLTYTWLCFECPPGRTSEATMLTHFDVPALLQSLPLKTLDAAGGRGTVPWYREYVARNRYDDLWRALNVRKDFARVRAPMLLTGGWYDYYAGETFRNFEALRRQAPTPELRDSHRVVVGPWAHGMQLDGTLGEIDFGDAAMREEWGHPERWMDVLLKGGTPQQAQAAPVRIFVMGVNRWRSEQEWPPARTRYQDWFLHPGGILSPDTPPAGTRDTFSYDPDNPVPSHGGNHSIGRSSPGLSQLLKPGPFDQREIEARPDVLVYTSDVLRENLEVTGPVVVTLFAASSAPDTDFVARLTDVHPDGRSINITEGILRARFRGGVWDAPQRMQPGEVYAFAIDLQATSNVFLAGHRIRLHITSSSFPLWDRNLNTGLNPATDTTRQVALQTVCHGQPHPSRIRLPVIPNGD